MRHQGILKPLFLKKSLNLLLIQQICSLSRNLLSRFSQKRLASITQRNKTHTITFPTPKQFSLQRKKGGGGRLILLIKKENE